MLYKTMVLEIIRQRPELYEQLRSKRALPKTLNLIAGRLKNQHQAWKVQLARSKPESDQKQVASEALELALQELQDSLPSVSPPNDEALSLEAAMASILMPPA